MLKHFMDEKYIGSEEGTIKDAVTALVAKPEKICL